MATFLYTLRYQPTVFGLLVSFVDTLIGLPSTTSHVECTTEERIQLGIPEGLIRCSAGIEDTEELMHKFKKALQAID